MNNLPPLAPLPRDQRNIDVDHLNLLSIFYFVTAGLKFLGLFFIAGYCLLINAFFMNPAFWRDQKQAPPPGFVFAIIIGVMVMLGGLTLISGIVNLMEGFFLRQRKHRTFSMVVAAVNCLQIPLGTVLGVFTIMVLIRPSVVQMYDEEERYGG
jgi:ABC-type phosphate transport system permease subunit